MSMTEAARIIIGLRNIGWSETKINNFILWIDTGDLKYRPEERCGGGTPMSRLVNALHILDWTDAEANEFILWIGTGDENYKPRFKT